MRRTVLILDDSLTVRMDLSEAFEAAGFRPAPCATAAQARELLAREAADVVILDVLLPDADGVDFLREVRTATSSSAAVVLMLSTEAEVTDRIRGLQTGADEYIGKPYDRGYVVAKAQELLRARTHAATDVTTVLVIDDSLTFREALRRACEEVGYRVLTAGSGDEGLRIAAGERPGAIVVDDVLPGIDGATVIRRIRLDAALRRVPCLLLTASEDRGAELRAFDAGADAFERKAEDVAVILAKLAALLRRVTSGTPADGTTSVLGPKKILAVDDSMTYLQELAGLLRSEGYDPVLARSGEEALELVAIQAVDCILLDLLMPGLSGQETCRLIKSAPVVRDVPLIMLTALEDREAMIQALGAGADDYIPKSSEVEVLTARVRAQLRRKQFEDENRQIREELLRKELDAADAHAARQLAETRAALVGELERKNQELEAARAEAEEAREDAEQASRAKSEFLSRMSHELRTPLNAILGFAQLLQLDDLDSKHESVDHILRAGRHLLQLIDEVLDVARIEEGRLSLSIEPVHLDEVVREALDLIRPVATLPNIRISIETSQFDRHALADRQRLKQVLMNLLSNAVKYNRKGGTVTLSCEPTPGGRLRIAVADTGPGIPSEMMDQVFLPFERLGAERTPVEGTGIGLSISKHLVEFMGGDIGAESEMGRGSTFWVDLDPAEAPEKQEMPTAEDAPRAPAPAAGEQTVLYVEDNLSNLRLVERILARRPTIRLVAAMQGTLALELARQHLPDLILLDVHLPDIEGDEVLRRLQADPATSAIPVVTVSAEATPAKIERLLAAGAHAYLTKPLDVNRFLEIIDEVLSESMQ